MITGLNLELGIKIFSYKSSKHEYLEKKTQTHAHSPYRIHFLHASGQFMFSIARPCAHHLNAPQHVQRNTSRASFLKTCMACTWQRGWDLSALWGWGHEETKVQLDKWLHGQTVCLLSLNCSMIFKDLWWATCTCRALVVLHTLRYISASHEYGARTRSFVLRSKWLAESGCRNYA